MTSIINEKKDEKDDDDGGRHKKNIENGIAPSISDIGKKTPSHPPLPSAFLRAPYLIAHSFSILFFLYLLLPVSIATVIGILADFGRKKNRSSESERQR